MSYDCPTPFGAMVGSSLLGATPPRVLASEYSQEYFRPGPDGNDRRAKHLTIIESDGRDVQYGEGTRCY